MQSKEMKEEVKWKREELARVKNERKRRKLRKILKEKRR